MIFAYFPVATTNIFPISNSKLGGQLVTEFNLRSREMVGTTPEIPYNYSIGPSYVHGVNDFDVSISKSSSTILEIAPGKAVINGHFIESLSPIEIDIADANSKRVMEGNLPLSGSLAIGIRIIYSTEKTMSGSMQVENNEGVYTGVQLVILPINDLITPSDISLDDEGNPSWREEDITAHLKLATFTYYNKTLSKPIQNEHKLEYVDARRIANIEMMLSDQYMKKPENADVDKFYVYSGKSASSDRDYNWCDATKSLMVWDNRNGQDLINTQYVDSDESANFTTSKDDVVFRIPHKQPDKVINDENGNRKYYQPVRLKLPKADYNTNTPGVVSKAYTQNIKSISDKLSGLYRLTNGKQRQFIDVLNNVADLPSINSNWAIGDYVIVRDDFTVEESTDGVAPPSTMYAVIPGVIKTLRYVGCMEHGANNASTFYKPDGTYSTISSRYDPCGGVLLGELYYDEKEEDIAPDKHSGKFADETMPVFFEKDVDNINGAYEDYFVLNYFYTVENSEGTDQCCDKYYYSPFTCDAREWSNPVLLTGQIPFAQEDVIGGFYNVSPDDALDGGYVYRDDNGFLRVIDYALLRQGTLAYQLGEDITLSSGVTTDEIQQELNQYVNQRIAFPNDAQNGQSTNPSVINLYIELPKETESKSITIYGIDSRFGASVYIHFTGEVDSNTTINIVNCEKVRIANNLSSYDNGPKLNIYNSCIYYDADLFDYIRNSHIGEPQEGSGMQGITLWYEQMEDTDRNLYVDNMTVYSLDQPIVSKSVKFKNKSVSQDWHYAYGLKSITFASDGNIVGCEILICDNTTNGALPGTSNEILCGSFELPQGKDLYYPVNCLTKQLKVTGTFVAAYLSESGSNKWIVRDNNFTILTDKYDLDSDEHQIGSIALHVCSNEIVTDVDNVPDGWKDTYHRFSGGTIQ